MAVSGLEAAAPYIFGFFGSKSQMVISSDIVMNRTALLIRCTQEEADTLRTQAWTDFRTVSSYVLYVLHRALAVEDNLFARLTPYRYAFLNRVQARTATRAPGPRTAVLVRCSVDEAARIRLAARRRELSISGFVLQILHRFWDASATIAKKYPAHPGRK